MKKLALFLGLGLFAFSGTFGQTAPTEAADNKNAPEIVFEKTEYDFGTIPYDSNGTFEFTFKNGGKEPLLISNVQKGCQCTSTDWTKEPVKKGKSGVVKVTYNTKITGPFTKSITVFSNAKTPAFALTFKGVVSPPPAQPEQTKQQ